MIEFKSVRYVNFQSVGNRGIKVDLTRSPTTLVGGHNGAGKSTLLEAIVYCLFGKPLKKINIGGLVNTINLKNLVTEVEFTRRGKSYRIVRGQKPAKLELWIGSELVDQSASVRDYQAKIEYVLGMDYKLFTQIVVLNKEKYVPFMDLDASSRRKVVEDILDISVFSSMSDILKEKSKVHSIQLNDVKFDRERLLERVKGKQRLLDEAQQNVDDHVTELRRQIIEIQDEVISKKCYVDDLDDKLTEVADAQVLLNALVAKKAECDKVSTQFKVNLDNHARTIAFYTDNDLCPTCKGGITDETKAHSIDLCNSKISDIRNNAQVLVGVYQKLLDDIELQNRRLQLKRTLDTDKQVSNRSIDMMLSQIESLNTQIAKSGNSDKLEEIEREFLSTQSELSTKTAELDALLELEVTLNSSKTLLRDDQIKASVVRDYIDFINTKVNEQLCAMEFYLNIVLDENFNDSINAVNKKGFTYDNLSTGQKARVNLAIWLALLEVASIKNSVVTNVLFLDEILEPIDKEGVALFMALVKDKLPHKNTFVVTQRFDEFKDYFRSELKFNLIDGFTEIL